MITRRSFISATGLAFLGLQRYASAENPSRLIGPFGPLVRDPGGVIDLPAGFSYRILARRGDTMADGFKTPGQPDGMAAFPTDDGKLVLVCNHELGLKSVPEGPFADNSKLPEGFDAGMAFDGGPG